MLEPAALAATAQALTDAEQAHAATLRTFELTVERARYEADRARRQYDAVEPENRLVARTLERALEAKLAAQRQAERDLVAAQARRPVRLTDEELAWLSRAGADVRAIFTAPSTSSGNANSCCAPSSTRSSSPSTPWPEPPRCGSSGKAAPAPSWPWR